MSYNRQTGSLRVREILDARTRPLPQTSPPPRLVSRSTAPRTASLSSRSRVSETARSRTLRTVGLDDIYDPRREGDPGLLDGYNNGARANRRYDPEYRPSYTEGVRSETTRFRPPVRRPSSVPPRPAARRTSTAAQYRRILRELAALKKQQADQDRRVRQNTRDLEDILGTGVGSRRALPDDEFDPEPTFAPSQGTTLPRTNRRFDAGTNRPRGLTLPLPPGDGLGDLDEPPLMRRRTL